MTAPNCASNWTSAAPNRSFQIAAIGNSRSPSTSALQAALAHRGGVQQIEGLQAHRNPLRQIGPKLSRLCLPRRRSCMVGLMSLGPSKSLFRAGCAGPGILRRGIASACLRWRVSAFPWTRSLVWLRAGGPLDNGRLRYREDIVDGLQNYPGTIAELYRGEISQVVRDED